MPFTVLYADEWNDGNLLWRTGQVAAAAEVALHNINALQACGAKTVVCSDAEALSVVRDFYPRVAEPGFVTRHITEVVADALQAGRLRLARRVDRQVTYHDPCYLGRLSEPYIHWDGGGRSSTVTCRPSPGVAVRRACTTRAGRVLRAIPRDCG